VPPGICHLVDELGHKVGKRCEDTLDSAELSECIHSAASQGLPHLVDLCDRDHLEGAGVVGVIGAGVAGHCVGFEEGFEEGFVEVVGLALKDWMGIMCLRRRR